MKKRFVFVAAIAAFFMLPFLTLTARAEPDELPQPEIVDVITGELPVLPDDFPSADVPTQDVGGEIPVTDFYIAPPSPFTPSGTGTVIDHATDGDGKEFYTITTLDEHIFYLVIDRQRNSENVYFLNAVTVADLMALAETPESPTPSPGFTEPPQGALGQGHEPAPEPPPAQDDNERGSSGLIIMIAVVVIVGGGVGWYFKIYKPKQLMSGMEEDYSSDDASGYGDGEYDPYGQDEAHSSDPPWLVDGAIPEDDGE